MTRILVADDDPHFLKPIEIVLKEMNFDVVTANTGEKALQLGLTEKFDLILLDVMMPPPNGMEVCKKLKSQMKNFVPIVLMTSRGDLDSKLQGFDHGANDYLVKPFAMEELTARVGSMLKIKNLNDDLRQVSVTDSLTGIYNRRYFQMHLADECRRASRYKTHFSCLLIDLDKFKEVNDRYGHDAGDQTLKQVVRLVQTLLRKSDIFIRYGGDEFMVVLPDTSLKGAEDLAERIRIELEKTPVFQEKGSSLNKKGPITVTCSIGVCGFPSPHIQDIDQLIGALDTGLYKAKAAGRNCVNVVTFDNFPSPKTYDKSKMTI